VSEHDETEPSYRVVASKSTLGEIIYSHIRLMVVVKESKGCCLCL
jgi:hypothetical protein